MDDIKILEIAHPKGKVAAIGASEKFMEALSRTPRVTLCRDSAAGCDTIYEIGAYQSLTLERAIALKGLIHPIGTVYLCGNDSETQENIIGAEAIMSKAGFLCDFSGYAGLEWDSKATQRPVLRCGRYRKE
jgi:hypothetical protein